MVSALTLERYTNAADLFSRWARKHRSGKRLRSGAAVDRAVSDYIEFLWSRNAGLSNATTTLASLQHFRLWLRGELKEGWKLVHTWRREEKANKAVPASRLVATAIASAVFEDGFVQRAACLVSGFEGFLRGAEMSTFTSKDARLLKKRAILRLRSTKTLGYRRADAELAVIRSPFARKLLKKAKDLATDDDAPLCGCSASALRSHVQRACKRLGLHKVGFTLHSWRRGAATEDFLRFGSMEGTLLRGRWSSNKICRDYISEATAALADAEVGPQVKSRLRAAVARFRSAVR